MKVLFLSAWYPTERDQMSGLFVQKHKEALERQGVEVRVAYNEEKGTLCSLKKLRQEVKQFLDEGWRPDIVQVNVLNKNALIAYWLKKHYGIPYVIVEHWSGYLPQNYSIRGGWHLKLMKTLAREASCIMPVSQRLKCAMMDCGIENDLWLVIRNVVDDFFYEKTSQVKEKTSKTKLLHVSCFDEKAKNVKGLLRAARKMAETRQDFTLTLVGTGVDWVDDKAYAESLNFPDGMLTWTGEQTPEQVCQWMQQSDAFVLFSRYETYGVVLTECLAIGLPIVSSNVGIAEEIIRPNTGLIVPSENETALVKALTQMLDHYQEFDSELMREQGRSCNYSCVGEELYKILSSCIKPRY